MTDTSMWSFEKENAEKGYTSIAGVDEAGRGPLAGPVVSAAVVLPTDLVDKGINDSKKLTPKQRDRLFDFIMHQAVAVGVGLADVQEIDRINILQASLLSMKRAVLDLTSPADYLLIDGKFPINLSLPQEALIKGDSRSLSIAAASIIAKVTRDRMMVQLHNTYPIYGFDRHKGYPTKAHREALLIHGPCPEHRKSFRGVKELLL